MIELICPQCKKRYNLGCQGDVTIRGTIECRDHKHERPFVIEGSPFGGSSWGYLQVLDIALPSEESKKLLPSVPDGIKEDIQEAERAHCAQCYNATVAMCRRALQLSLVEKRIADAKLSGMMREALDKKLMGQDTYNLATSIKGYGDIGVHRREQLEPKEVGLVIYMTVRILNEFFAPQP